MTSTYFNPLPWDVLYHHHIVSLLGDSLEHYMLACWLLYWEQFILDTVLFNEPRILLFAYFAEKLLKVVLDCTTNDFLLYLRLVPFL